VFALVVVGEGASESARPGAYTGSFFKLPKWKYIQHLPNTYPFEPLVTLWEAGLVPSFDGNTWRLHGRPKGEILFSVTKEELAKR